MAATSYAPICAQLKRLIKLFKEYQWLTDSYMLDFFTEGLYEKLPASWTDFFLKLEVKEFGPFLDLTVPLRANYVWPLSLLALRKILQTSTMPWSQDCVSYSCHAYQTSQEKPKQTPCFLHARSKYLFMKNVKPKKRYEVNKFAEEIARIAVKSGVRWVIDIGSGLGHLCRILAYGYGLNVIGVETQSELSSRARKLDKGFEAKARTFLTAEEMAFVRRCRPIHQQFTIDFHTTSEVLTQIIAEHSDAGAEDFGIVGLHPCGDLAAILLHAFIRCPRAKFINVVGCCYHKLNVGESENRGFPLSRIVAAEMPCLSVVALALGCHSNEAYSARLISGDFTYLKVHCYRATLEKIIARRWPSYTHSGVNNVRYCPGLTFAQYCEKALKTLGLTVPEEDFQSQEILECLARWKDVVFFHSLWLMLGPAVETVILLDRLLYLSENGISCQLQAVFDPLVSPRNQILSAIKLS